jgi:hypothetical protein
MGKNTKSGSVLSAKSSAELLSYIINVTPELKGEIDLPKQGESIKEIGKIIIDNQRYRNAFINTVNLIGLTVIKRNAWENPWDFTKRGTLRFGQQIRELINDLCNVYDYNTNFSDKDRFLSTIVPNVYNYIHEVNFQKFYQTTTSDSQLAMAFDSEESLFEFIDNAIVMLYESLKYDTYIVDKYMLCRRILDGTVTSIKLANYSALTPRQRVSALKSVSNKMTFRSPNYNPAGIRKATSFEDQFAIVSNRFDAKFTTNVLATSYFRSDAAMKAGYELCDGFGNFDIPRLNEIFGKRDDDGNLIPNEYLDGYVPLTQAEMTALQEIPVVLVGMDFFQDRYYGADNMVPGRKTEFFNPQTMRTNHWLHTWGVLSSSPFENAICFTTSPQSITSVTVSPSTATVSKGQNLQLSAEVVTTGFTNKAVYWSIDTASCTDGIRISDSGKLIVPSDATVTEVTVTATSIYDNTKTGTATITVA